MKTISKLILPLFLLCILVGACSKEKKCNLAMLSFNNKLSVKITVIVYGKGTLHIEPGKSETIKVRPYETYEYNVLNFYDGHVLARSEESVESCVSKGINIK